VTLDAHIRPLDLYLHPSRRRRALTLALHLLAAAAVLIAPANGALPAVVGAALLIAIAASAVAAWRRASRGCQLHWGEDQFIEVQRDGEPQVCRCRLQADSRLWPALVVLQLRDERGARLYLPVWSDQLDARAFRHLRVRLTLDGQRAVDAGEGAGVD